jgi:hypothetical protein
MQPAIFPVVLHKAHPIVLYIVTTRGQTSTVPLPKAPGTLLGAEQGAVTPTPSHDHRVVATRAPVTRQLSSRVTGNQLRPVVCGERRQVRVVLYHDDTGPTCPPGRCADLMGIRGEGLATPRFVLVLTTTRRGTPLLLVRPQRARYRGCLAVDNRTTISTSPSSLDAFQVEEVKSQSLCGTWRQRIAEYVQYMPTSPTHSTKGAQTDIADCFTEGEKRNRRDSTTGNVFPDCPRR